MAELTSEQTERLAEGLATHRLNTPVQCICGWRETDGDPGAQGDRWAAHAVACAIAPTVAALVAEGTTRAMEETLRQWLADREAHAALRKRIEAYADQVDARIAAVLGTHGEVPHITLSAPETARRVRALLDEPTDPAADGAEGGGGRG